MQSSVPQSLLGPVVRIRRWPLDLPALQGQLGSRQQESPRRRRPRSSDFGAAFRE
ncbi:hypothetical protein LINPERHAP1_LOCUS20571 [Linum perenne]